MNSRIAGLRLKIDEFDERGKKTMVPWFSDGKYNQNVFIASFEEYGIGEHT